MTITIASSTSTQEQLDRAVREDWRTHGYDIKPEAPEDPLPFRTARSLRPGEPEPTGESEAQRVTEAYSRQLADIRRKEPDFDDTMKDSEDIQIPVASYKEILRMENGAEVAHYYALHPKEAEKLLEQKDGGIEAVHKRSERLKNPSMKEYIATRQRQTGRKGNRI